MAPIRDWTGAITFFPQIHHTILRETTVQRINAGDTETKT